MVVKHYDYMAVLLSKMAQSKMLNFFWTLEHRSQLSVVSCVKLITASFLMSQSHLLEELVERRELVNPLNATWYLNQDALIHIA